MMAKNRFAVLSFLVAALFVGLQGRLLADGCSDPNTPAPCERVGPQSARDIEMKFGTNPVRFSQAPPIERLKLCDIHFHRFAEHKIPGSVAAQPPGKGFVCPIPRRARFSPEGEIADRKVCESVGLFDTVEVHWVYTTCNVDPAPCLGSCFSKSCLNPELRVAAQLFYVTPDNYPRAIDWADAGYDTTPPRPHRNVEYMGSTTGSVFNGVNTCSPYQATWSVSPRCLPLTMASLGSWCERNEFDERKPHGVRDLVTDPKLLSRIP